MPKTCLLLPHGLYSLVITILVTTGWLAALFEDGCNYAKLSGDLISDLALSPDTPYVEVGLQAYRMPALNLQAEDWDPVFVGQCVAYPTTVTQDTPWNLAKGFSFLALVLGGGATFYLWISTCCRFSRGSWRWAGYEVAAACLFQLLSFVWFLTAMCQTNTCELFYGSKADIASSLLWLLAAVLIFCHYPAPKEMVEGDGVLNTSSGSGGSNSSASSQRRRRSRDSNDDDTGDISMTPIATSTSLSKEDEQLDVEMAAGEDSRQSKPKLDDIELT